MNYKFFAILFLILPVFASAKIDCYLDRAEFESLEVKPNQTEEIDLYVPISRMCGFAVYTQGVLSPDKVSKLNTFRYFGGSRTIMYNHVRYRYTNTLSVPVWVHVSWSKEIRNAVIFESQKVEIPEPAVVHITVIEPNEEKAGESARVASSGLDEQQLLERDINEATAGLESAEFGLGQPGEDEYQVGGSVVDAVLAEPDADVEAVEWERLSPDPSGVSMRISSEESSDWVKVDVTEKAAAEDGRTQ